MICVNILSKSNAWRPDKTPDIIALNIQQGDNNYLNWITETLNQHMKLFVTKSLFGLLLCCLGFFAMAQQSIFDKSAISSLTQSTPQFAAVDDVFQFNFDQQQDKLNISFIIKDGYYLYRHQFKIKSKNTIIKPVDLPKGLPHEDEFFGVQQIYKQQLNFTINLEQVDKNAEVTVRYQGCAAKGLCYPPQIKVIPVAQLHLVNASQPPITDSILAALGASSNSTAQTSTTNNTTHAAAPVSEQNILALKLQQGNLGLTLIAFFIGGLLLAFTPCVFPMYPILTSIIVGQGKQLTNQRAFRLSFVYVQGMAITYTLLGVVVALAGAQFQAMFQNPIVLISLSVLFVVLALSMFNVFNLALPASWQNRLNQLSNKQQGGSYYGVLIMGIISGLVASPCTTAPLTGALLYISQTGNIALGAAALYVLSLGMGLPLLILGSSGGKLLPKAGGWMNIIKNSFGLLLLAVPIFLLQRMIPDNITNILWLILLLASATYFYVVNQQSFAKHQGFWFGLRSLVILFILIWGCVQLIQTFSTNNNQHVTPINKIESKKLQFSRVKNISELTQKIQQASQQGKSVMIDFYADWCVACKEFEQYTFNKPDVINALSNTVPVQIDLTNTGAPENIALMQKFNILGLPTILFFNRQGQELSQQRVTGFMNANEFSQHIKSILATQ